METVICVACTLGAMIWYTVGAVFTFRGKEEKGKWLRQVFQILTALALCVCWYTKRVDALLCIGLLAAIFFSVIVSVVGEVLIRGKSEQVAHKTSILLVAAGVGLSAGIIALSATYGFQHTAKEKENVANSESNVNEESNNGEKEDGTGIIDTENLDAEGLEEVPEVPEYTASEYVELGDFSTIVLEMEQYEVTDEDVTAVEQQVIEQNATYEEVDKSVVEVGDSINVTYAPVVDGEVDSESMVEGVTFDLDADVLEYDDLLSQLVGATVGSTENYDIVYDGEESVTYTYQITVNSINEKILPELTDEFVQQISADSTTVEDWHEEMRTQLEESYASEAESNLRSSLQTAVLEQCTVKSLPEGLEEARMIEYMNNDRKAAASAEISFEQFITDYYGFASEDDYREELSAYIKETCECEVMLKAVQEVNGLELADEDYDAFCNEASGTYGFSSVEEFVEYYGEDRVREAATSEMVWKFLETQVTINEE